MYKHYSRRARATSSGYYANQVADLYNFPLATGEGQTIGIIELGGGFSTKDLQAYATKLGLPGINITAIAVDDAANVPGKDPGGSDGEVLLDIEIAYSVAPKAALRVYFCPNTDQGFLGGINKAVADKCNIISISWGGPEDQWDSASVAKFEQAFQNAASAGVTVLCAAGDNDSGDGEAGNHVDYPGSSPNVLCVGGTNTQSANGVITSETVWNDGNNEGTGGGYSALFKIPQWQVRDKVAGTARMVPDITSNADPNSGYNVYIDGQWQVVGGTSSGPPLIAGLIARLNQILGSPLGYINPLLYRMNSRSFKDITVGNNNTYGAAVGCDPVSGLGRLRGDNLVEDVKWVLANTNK